MYQPFVFDNLRAPRVGSPAPGQHSSSQIVDLSLGKGSSQNLMTVKKRSGFSSETRVNQVPAGKASPKATGRIEGDFVTERPLRSIRRYAYCMHLLQIRIGQLALQLINSCARLGYLIG